MPSTSGGLRFGQVRTSGTIEIPPSAYEALWRIKVTKPDGTVYTIAHETNQDYAKCPGGGISRRATSGLSNFQFNVLSRDREFLDTFDEGDIVDVWASYSGSINENNDHLFRGEIDEAPMSFAGGQPSVELIGRDYPRFIADGAVIIQFVGQNIIDCFIDRTEPTGTQDSQGNYEGGLLYETGLTLQVYDHSNAQDWVTPATMSEGDFTTLKTVFNTAVTDQYQNKTHASIAKDLATKPTNVLDWYLHYDYSASKWYLRLFERYQLQNTQESAVSHQNWFSGPNRLSIPKRDIIDEVRIYGKSEGNFPIIRTKTNADSTRAYKRVKVVSFSTLDTSDLCDDKAQQILDNSQYTKEVADGIQVHGMISLKPGESIRHTNLEIGMSGYFFISQFNMSLSENGIVTSYDVERDATSLSIQQKDTDEAINNIKLYNNINDANQVIALNFDEDESGSKYSLVDSNITDGVLLLDTGKITGSLESLNNVDWFFPRVINKVELRIEGNSYTNCEFEISNTGNSVDAVPISPGELLEFNTEGSQIYFKATLNVYQDQSPQFKKMYLLIQTEE